MIKIINKEEILGLMEKSEAFALVEALGEKYYNDAHIPGAVQMDYTEVIEKAPSLLADKSQKVVVYCASSECENSTKAAHILEQLGYEEIYVYKKGKKDWTESGLGIETTKKPNHQIL